MRSRVWPVGLTVAVTIAVSVSGVVASPARSQEAAVSIVGGETAVGPSIAAQIERCAGTPPARADGAGRYETAALVAIGTGSPGGTVFVATGLAFPDALSAGPAAVRTDATVLLTDPAVLPQATRVALDELDPADIVIVGGESSVGPDVARELQRYAPTTRIGGEDRYATAAAVARATHDATAVPGTVWLATGETFADAVAAAGAAGVEGAPILLTTRDRLPAATRQALDELEPVEVVIVGGDAAVSPAVADEVAAAGRRVTRLAGRDRFETAVAVGRRAFPSASAAVLGTGLAFPDALAAAPLVAARRAPLLLTAGDVLPGPTGADLASRGVTGACSTRDFRAGSGELPAMRTGVALTATWGHLSAPVHAGSPARILGHHDDAVRVAYPAPIHAPHQQVSWEQRAPAGTDPVILQQAWRGQRPTAPGGIVLAWQATGSTSGNYRAQVDAAPGLNVTSPFTWRLRADSGLTGIPDAAFNRDMHARGVKVWPAFVSTDPDAIHDHFTDPTKRRAIVRTISDQARDHGADGINVDVEGFHDRSREAFVAFLEELVPAVHAWGGVVSVDVTTMTDSWATPPEAEYSFWSTALDRRAIGRLADYTILMAYDEHHRLRPYGPVASDPWVEEGLAYQLRFVDPDRLVLGIPFYGAIWRTSTNHPSYVGIGTIQDLVGQGRATWDPEHREYRIDLPDGRFFWAQTPDDLRHRTRLVDEVGLAGVAGWRLGFDDPRTWRALAD